MKDVIQYIVSDYIVLIIVLGLLLLSIGIILNLAASGVLVKNIYSDKDIDKDKATAFGNKCLYSAAVLLLLGLVLQIALTGKEMPLENDENDTTIDTTHANRNFEELKTPAESVPQRSQQNQKFKVSKSQIHTWEVIYKGKSVVNPKLLVEDCSGCFEVLESRNGKISVKVNNQLVDMSKNYKFIISSNGGKLFDKHMSLTNINFIIQ